MPLRSRQQIQKAILLKHDVKEIASALSRAHNNEENFRISFSRILFKIGNPTAALKNLFKAAKLNPESFEAYYHIGNYYFENEEIDKAIVSYRRCLGINPEHAECRNNLGVILYYKGDVANSKKEFEIAKTIRSDFVDAEFNLHCIMNNSEDRKLKAIS